MSREYEKEKSNYKFLYFPRRYSGNFCRALLCGTYSNFQSGIRYVLIFEGHILHDRRWSGFDACYYAW